MTENGQAPVRRGGGPRPPGDARRLVLDAAFDLLAERGMEGTSIDAISERAGVSKATVYRYWSSKRELVVDAVRRLGALGDIRESDDPRADALHLLTQLATMLTCSPAGRLLPRLVSAAAQDDVLAATWQAEVIAPRREGVARIVRRAVDAGQLPPDTDVDLVVDVLVGPIQYRHLVSGADPTALPAALVALIWDGIRG